MLVRDKINQIARLLYERMGYEQPEGFDFESSQHPQERTCFDLACLAWQEITGDSPDLESDYLGDDEPVLTASSPHFSRSMMPINRHPASYAGQVENDTNSLMEQVTSSLEQALQTNNPSD